MRISILLFLTIVTCFVGCKKCDTDALSGTYLVSGTSHGSYPNVDTNGNVHFIDTTIIVANRTIVFTKIDEVTLRKSSPPYASTDYVHSSDNSSPKVCCFIVDYHGNGYGLDTVWFDKNRSHTITIRSHYSTLMTSSSSDLTGRKM